MKNRRRVVLRRHQGDVRNPSSIFNEHPRLTLFFLFSRRCLLVERANEALTWVSFWDRSAKAVSMSARAASFRSRARRNRSGC